MSQQNIEASPMSRAQIRDLTFKLRKLTGYETTPYVPVDDLIEFKLPSLINGFIYDIRPIDVMGAETHGLADPNRNKVYIREDVYERAADGKGRDRQTVIHEVGHVLLHKSDRLQHRRASGPPLTYRDPEWQAKAFAGEFLVCWRLLNGCQDDTDIAEKFGVSLDAARFQISKFEEAGIIEKGQIRRPDL